VVERVLVGIVLGIAGIFAFLTILIVGNKVWRDARSRGLERRRRTLEPELLRYLDGGNEPIPETHGAGDRRVVESILADHAMHLRGPERERLRLAFEELGLVDEYLSGLRHRYWWRRADAAEKLGHTRARRAIPDLIRAMEDRESSEVRLRAAKALGALSDRSSIAPLIRALNEPSRWSTIRIADILTEIGPRALRELTVEFDGMNPHARVAAIDIVAAIGHRQSAEWLRERLADPERDVRSRAAHALGAIGDRGAGTDLMRALEDNEWPVRAMAAKALGALLHVDAIEALCGCLRDPEWWVRSNAAAALRCMGPAGLAALERLLDDPDPYARHQAVLMIQDSGLFDEEVANLVDPAPDRRAAARSLVDRLVHAGQHARLTELAEEHPRSEIRALLWQALARGASGDTSS